MSRFERQSTAWILSSLLVAPLTPIVPTALGQAASAARPSPASRDSMVYTCPMDLDVRSAEPGSCIRCGMPLVTVAALLDPVRYDLELETAPASPEPGGKLRLRFLIRDPQTGQGVKDFHIVHEMPFHLFIVSHDLEYYDHVHPTQREDGSFTLETVLPGPGDYELFSDLFPMGGTPQVIRRSVSAAGPPPAAHGALQTPFERETLVRSVDGIRFELALEPTQPVAGQPTLLKYYLADAETRLPVTDLQPYLGAWGHSVTLREDVTDFRHSHSTRLVPAGIDRSRLRSGPRVAFNTLFARPGTHRIWSQFQRRGRVVTVSHTVSVSRLDRLARWDGDSWSPFPRGPINGLDGTARALAASGRNLYLGGDFTFVDGVRANGIAKWDGHKWSALGSGVNGKVWAIAVRGSEVYVGGDFTTAGGQSARGIARWDGSQWSALGTGVGGGSAAFGAATVHALAASEKQVYAGGRFSTAGGVSANGIAMWNGHGWSALGDGVRTGIYEGIVRALALHGPDLYAGGQFVTAGGLRAHNVARWNGVRWSALGSGIRGNLEKVLAIGTSGDDIYVGGLFTMAGGLRAPNIAKWSGRAWSSLDVQAGDGVWAIAVSGHHVYAGGTSFPLENGAVAKGIVKWDGVKWSSVGTGVGAEAHAGPIMAIAPSGESLYVGGDAFSLPATNVPSVVTAK